MPYVDAEAIEAARQIDLLNYLQAYEPGELVRVSGSTYCTREHDSLKIFNGKWHWFSRGIGGRNALDYLVKVKEMMPLAEVYVYEDDCTKQIGGFIGMNDNYIEGIFVKKAVQSKGIGKQLLNYAKEGKSTLRLSVYQKNKKAIRFYLREEFAIQSENIDNNTDEKEFVMVWNR